MSIANCHGMSRWLDKGRAPCRDKRNNLYYVVSYKTNRSVVYQAYKGFKCYAYNTQTYGVQPVVLELLVLAALRHICFILFCGSLELE
jgi:hypothetical protein